MRPKFRIAMLFALAALLCVAVASCPMTAAPADSSDESQIRAVIEMQASAWNRGDIETFMNGYWKSDQTAFVGAAGITRGWQAVLDRYHRNYPDQKAMGHLSFSNLEVHILCPDAAFVIGQFQLVRINDKPAGIFSLDFKKFPEGWRIILDHSTAFPTPTPPAASH